MHINPEKPENRGFLSDPTIYACTDYPVPIDTKLARHAKSNNPGSAICIHGNCVSAGCISMNNADYLEIYYLMAQHSVQRYGSLRIHILPFRFYRDCNADEIGIEELDNRSFCKTDYFAQIEAEAESAASRSPQLQNLGKEIIYKIWMHYAQRELQFLKAPSKDSAELQLTEDVIALLSHNFSERRIGLSCVVCHLAPIFGLSSQFHVSEEFFQCVKNCVIVPHGSELLAKGGFRRFPFSMESALNQL